MLLSTSRAVPPCGARADEGRGEKPEQAGTGQVPSPPVAGSSSRHRAEACFWGAPDVAGDMVPSVRVCLSGRAGGSHAPMMPPPDDIGEWPSRRTIRGREGGSSAASVLTGSLRQGGEPSVLQQVQAPPGHGRGLVPAQPFREAASMGPLAPVTLFVAGSLLHAAGAVDPTYNLARPLGSSVDFSVAIPKGSNYTFVVLQSTTRGEAVVLWEPGKSLRVLNPSYANRIVLMKDASTFRVHNLTLADGGDYEVRLRVPERLQDTLLRKYTLFVFHINVTTEPLANSSCSVRLLCKAGTGRRTRVSYSWKEQKSGATLSQYPWLSLVLHPEDAQAHYTCTAQAHGIQSALSVGPYECCPHSAVVTGGAPRGRPAHSWISRATLAPLAIALLLLP